MGNEPGSDYKLADDAEVPDYYRFERVGARASDWPPGWSTVVDLELHRDAMYVLSRSGGGPRVMLALPYPAISAWNHTKAWIEVVTPRATRRFDTDLASQVARALSVATGRMTDEILFARDDQRRRQKLEAGLREHMEVDAFFNPS
jgi:hypothetical protein